jgi:hypothetical protein
MPTYLDLLPLELIEMIMNYKYLLLKKKHQIKFSKCLSDPDLKSITDIINLGHNLCERFKTGCVYCLMNENNQYLLVDYIEDDHVFYKFKGFCTKCLIYHESNKKCNKIELNNSQ